MDLDELRSWIGAARPSWPVTVLYEETAPTPAAVADFLGTPNVRRLESRVVVAGNVGAVVTAGGPELPPNPVATYLAGDLVWGPAMMLVGNAMGEWTP